MAAEQKQPNAHGGHRQRLKTRFVREGLDTFENHNALELLLFYAIPQRDTNELAHQLIEKYGSFSAVFDAPVESLMQVAGVGENTAVLIKLIPEIYAKYVKDKNCADVLFLKTAEAAGEYLVSQFAGKPHEQFLAVLMNHKCKVLNTVVISEGTVDSTPIHLRKITEAAIHSGAANLFLAHNHPDGVAVPSAADVDATRYLVRSLSTLGIRVNDHFIVAGNDWFSMATNKKFKILFQD